MRRRIIGLSAALVALATLVSFGMQASASPPTSGRLRFMVTLSPSVASQELTGRLLVAVSTTSSSDPIDQIDVTRPTPFWGMDVKKWAPGDSRVMFPGPNVAGYPIANLRDLPAGDYYVQPFLNIYTQFHRSDGSNVWLHMPCGDGGDFFSTGGNLYGNPVFMHLDGSHSGTVQLTLDQANPQPTVPPGGTCQQGNYTDTAHLVHVKIQSTLLSQYWGTPIYIGANVLLPWTYFDNPTAQYPVVYDQGHWPGGGVLSFSEAGTNAMSTYWRNPSTPQFIAVTIRHETPYYDDSYAVNSANLGPWGDAITQELIPYIDANFRTYPARWARSLTGGSTGGWEALAQMIFYPDVYDGTWAISPDPPDFRHHQVVNVYSDANAYVTHSGSWLDIPRPAARTASGDTSWTMEEENHWEAALGSHGRSQLGQWDIWQAVYGPQGADGYPATIWDKQTGDIDHTVATAWSPMDLRMYVVNNWATLGSKLTGRIHDYGGSEDTYFLNNASQDFQTALAALTSPPANADFQWVLFGRHGASPYTTQQLLTIMYNAMVADMPPGPKPDLKVHGSPPPAGNHVIANIDGSRVAR